MSSASAIAGRNGAGRAAGVSAGIAGALRRRLSGRPDSEHEISVNRFMLSWAIAALLIGASHLGSAEAQRILDLSIGMFWAYNALSLFLFAHLLVFPGVSVFRRCAGICIDLWIIAAFDGVDPMTAGYVYPLYLWTIFGNGFRFGIPYLAIAAAAGVSAFATVAFFGSHWGSHSSVATGMLVGLAILPAYVGLLIHKVSVARRQAEEANKAKSMFLASVSHELRTPLTAILGLTDLLHDTRLSSEQADMVRIVGSSGRGLLRLINSLLDISRSQVGQAPFKAQRFDLHGLLLEVRDMLLAPARAKGLHLALHVSARTPRHIVASERHLQETLVNLIGNAVKFTEKGQVLLAADLVGSAEGKLRLRFEVEDSGIGIARTAQGRIFEPFAQADESIIDRFGGTGLGLAISRQLVEAQNGAIGVISAEGRGSTFWFEIEALPDAVQPAGQAVAAPPAATPVLIYSGDPRIAAMAERVGREARLAGNLEAMRIEINRTAKLGFPSPPILLDEAALGAELEEFASQAARLNLPRPPTLIAIAAGADANILSAEGRRLFATSLPRPLSESQFRDALHLADGATLSRAAVVAPKARRSLSVLVAEDNRTNQMVIARILEKAGHRVQIANDGEAALDLLETGHFQIVLMDVNMPVLNGIEAAKLYHFTHVDEACVPIVALTADVSAASRERCLEAGMQACLSKPIDAAHLLATVEALAIDMPDFVAPADAAPRSAKDLAEPLDIAALRDLDALGGRGFTDEIVAQFTSDAASVLAALAAAASSGQVDAFRDQAHALRSCAANVGAQRVYATCLAWRDIDPAEMAANGAAYVAGLEAELDRAKASLAHYLANRPAEPPERPGLRLVSDAG